MNGITPPETHTKLAEVGDRVRHGNQRWPEAIARGAGTVVERVQIGRWPGAHVEMDADPVRGPFHPVYGEPYAYVAFYPDDSLIVVVPHGQ
jgi:hypothetical protein